MTNLTQIIQSGAANHPGRQAVVDRNRTVTYGELWTWVLDLSSYLQETLGTPLGHVGVMIPRSAEYITSYFAILQAGGVVVPIDPSMTRAELMATFDYCELRAIVTTDQYADALSGLYGLPVLSLAAEGLHMRVAGEGRFPSRPVPGAAVLLPTSGTLSAPKRVIHTHSNLLWNARAHAHSIGLTADDKCLVALPMHFGYCNTAQMICHLQLGGTLVLFPGTFAPRQFFNLVREHHITTVTAVPSMLQYLMDFCGNNPEVSRDSTLRYICFGGSPVNPGWVSRLQQAFPTADVVQTYGQTEAGPRITTMSTYRYPNKLDSVGKPLDGISLRIRDENDQDLPIGSAGEIQVLTPSVMIGYYRRDEETASVCSGEWLRTGDLGFLDADGFLYVTGRRKNLIIRAGCNIQPEEVEECLRLTSEVANVLVMGEADPIAGERVVAYVVPVAGAECSADSLLRHCRSLLSAYKVPARIEFVPALELTYNGKVRRVRPSGTSEATSKRE